MRENDAFAARLTTTSDMWIARDASDQLYAYTERPFSYPYGWDVSDGAILP